MKLSASTHNKMISTEVAVSDRTYSRGKIAENAPPASAPIARQDNNETRIVTTIATVGVAFARC